MSPKRNRQRAAALVAALPLFAGGFAALPSTASAAGGVRQANITLTLGRPSIGPKAGFRGDTDRGIAGHTAIMAFDLAASTTISTLTLRIDEGHPFALFRDFDSTDGVAIYKDTNSNDHLDAAEYAAGPVTTPTFGVSGDGQGAVVTVNGDPAKATGATTYLVVVHPIGGNATVKFSIPANGIVTSAGNLPDAAFAASDITLDSTPPAPIPTTQVAAMSRMPIANCPTSPAPPATCGNDGYKVWLGATPTEAGENLGFFNTSTDTTDAAILFKDDAHNLAVYPVAGLPIAQADAVELSIGNGTGLISGVAGSRALNNQISDTVYLGQWDLLGNLALVPLTNNRPCTTSASCTAANDPHQGNDVTAPKVTSYTVAMSNITSTSGINAVPVTGTVGGLDTAGPVDAAGSPTAEGQSAQMRQGVVLEHIDPSTSAVLHSGAQTYSALFTPSSGTATVTTNVDASDTSKFPEGGRLRATGILIDGFGNATAPPTLAPPVVRDTISPSFVRASLLDLNHDGQAQTGEKFRISFDDPINPTTIRQSNLDADLTVTDSAGNTFGAHSCGVPTPSTPDCVTWGTGATLAWDGNNTELTITLGTTCDTNLDCPGAPTTRLPVAGDKITAAATVVDPVGHGIVNKTNFVIGPPLLLAVEAKTGDTMWPTSTSLFSTNRDGILDFVDVDFTSAVTGQSVTAASGANRFKVSMPGTNTILPATATAINGNTTVRLSFTVAPADYAAWRTGTQPVVRYDATGCSGDNSCLGGPGNVDLASFTLTSNDRVPAVPISATTADSLNGSAAGSDGLIDHITIKYSEPVKVGVENPCGYNVSGYGSTTVTAPGSGSPTAPTTAQACPSTVNGLTFGSGRNKVTPVPANATSTDTFVIDLAPHTAPNWDTEVTPLVTFNYNNDLPPYPPTNTHPACVTSPGFPGNTTNPNCPIRDAANNALNFFSGFPVDLAGPAIVGRATRDADADGHLDGLLVDFSEDISTPSIGSAQFEITAPVTTVTGVTGSGPRQLTVLFAEGVGKGDTAVKPTLKFLGGVTDAVGTGNTATADANGVVVTDKAGPAITAACTAVPTGTAANRKGSCDTGSGDKMTLLFSEALDAASLQPADFVVKQLDASNVVQTKTATGATAVNATDGLSSTVTLTFAANSLDPAKDAQVALAAANTLTDNAAAPKNGNTQTGTITAFAIPVVTLTVTCPVPATKPGFCSADYVNINATSTTGVTGWKLVDTGASETAPADPVPGDFTNSQPNRYPPSASTAITEGHHHFWLAGKDDFDRITPWVPSAITVLKSPTIPTGSVKFLDLTGRISTASVPKWSASDTLLDGDQFKVLADAYGTDAAEWETETGDCSAANMSIDFRSTTKLSTAGAVAPFTCELKTNTEIPHRSMEFLAPTTGSRAVGTTRYPVGTVLKTSSSDPGFMVVDGPSGTLARRDFISVNARRSWMIKDASVIQVPSQVKSALPRLTGPNLGYRDGAIVHTSGSVNYYYVLNGERHWVSRTTLSSWRMPLTTAYTVTATELGAMVQKPGYGGGGHQVGTFIKYTNGAIYQIVKVGTSVRRRPLAATNALATLVPTSQVYPANSYDSQKPVDSFLRGYRDGTLLKISTGVYGVVSRGSLRKFANPQTFNTLGFNASNALTMSVTSMPRQSNQSYRLGVDINRYLIPTLVIRVSNTAGDVVTATVLPGPGGIYGVGTLDPIPVGWDPSWK